MLRTSLILALAACGADATSDATTYSTGTTTGTTAAGFTVEGTAVLLLDPASPAPNFCISVLDPTPALAGGAPTVLASAVIGADGTFSVAGIETGSTIGILMAVSDCDPLAPSGALLTATGIEAADYADAAAGTVLSGYTAFVIDDGTAATLTGGLAAAGYAGDIAVEGSLVGFVLDAANAPVDGATVGAPDDVSVFYMSATGLTSGPTSAAAGALFIIPAAPIFTYSATATGLTFAPVLAGSQPGTQVVIAFNGE